MSVADPNLAHSFLRKQRQVQRSKFGGNNGWLGKNATASVPYLDFDSITAAPHGSSGRMQQPEKACGGDRPWIFRIATSSRGFATAAGSSGRVLNRRTSGAYTTVSPGKYTAPPTHPSLTRPYREATVEALSNNPRVRRQLKTRSIRG